MYFFFWLLSFSVGYLPTELIQLKVSLFLKCSSRKCSYFSHIKVFYPRPQPLRKFQLLALDISLNFLVLQNPTPQEINIFLNCTIVKSVLPCTPVVSVLFFPLRFSYIVHLGKYELQCSHENHQLEYALFV